MPEPYIKVFNLPSGQRVSTVVLDLGEFEALADRLVSVFELRSKGRLSPEMAGQLKEAKHIPMLSRGTKTQFVFDEFGLETELASFIVRGEGSNVLGQLLG